MASEQFNLTTLTMWPLRVVEIAPSELIFNAGLFQPAHIELQLIFTLQEEQPLSSK